MRVVWTCKIAVDIDEPIPEGADFPMRRAVEEAFIEITGKEPTVNFSGWGGELDEFETRIMDSKLI